MRERTSLLVILIPLLLAPVLHLEADRKPSVAIISNEADRPTALFIGGLLSESNITFEIIGPKEFSRALEKHDVIIILGGPRAYEGVGEISSNYIPPDNATALMREPRTFLISVYKGGRDVIVIAGNTRRETSEAVPYFFKDSIRVTRLWRWAGYPVDFKDGSYAIYYRERYLYDNESMNFYPVPWGSEVVRAKRVTLNGTPLFNLTYKSSYLYLGVNYTTVSYYLVDELWRPRKCAFVNMMDGSVTQRMDECPSTSGGLGTVYLTFKMESYGNRTHFEIAGNSVSRSITYRVGDSQLRAVLVLKYAMRYPSWEAMAPFELLYVNPIIPFGGRVIEVSNRFMEGEVVTDTLVKLYSYRS
ncbi:MAG: hypothetical protein QXJ48_03840 [Candidatus Korarchaeum sp.]